METEVERVSCHHHLFIIIIVTSYLSSSSPLSPNNLPPQPDLDMEVALELLPILAKRSLLHNSQAASLEILLKLTPSSKKFFLF